MTISTRRAGKYIDPDLARYLRAAGPSSYVDALNAFVAGCKADGVWQLCDWIWPFAGKNLASALIPLKAPGALTPLTNHLLTATDYSETVGVSGDGTTKYLKAPINLTGYGVGTLSMSVYLSQPIDAPNGAGGIGGGFPLREIWPQQTSSGAIFFWNDSSTSNNAIPNPTDNIGLYLMSESGSNGYWTFRGAQLGTAKGLTPAAAGATVATSGTQLLILAVPSAINNPQQFSTAGIGFAHVGTTMSPAQIALFNARVEALMVAMGRRPDVTTAARLTGAVDGGLICGQSLAGAVNGTIVSGARPAYGNLGFPPGPGNWNATADFSKFTSLCENGQGSVSALNGMMAQGYPRPWLVGGAPVTATAYSGLKQGTNPYNVSLIGHRAAFTKLAALGATYIMRGLWCVHGEQDDLNNSTTYQADSTTWQTNYNTDLKAITGQSQNIPMYFSQVSSFSGYFVRTTASVSIAQWLAWQANPSTMICVGPKYIYTYAGDHVHLANGTQYRWMWEYYFKAVYQTITTGTPFAPLAPISAVRTGASIVLVMNKGGLVVDTTLVSDPSGTYASRKYLTGPASASDSTVTSFKGFEFMDDTTTAPSASVTGLAISTTNVANDTVTLTLSGTPTGTNKRIRYAFSNTSNVAPGPLTGPRGNLRDADTSYPSQFGNTLYNWCVHFDMDAS